MSAPVAPIEPLAPAGRAVWRALAELALSVTTDRWVVVGGQMVAIHAALAGLEPPAVTDDGDVVVDVRAHGRRAMKAVAQALVNADFTVTTSPEGVTRFERDIARIDLLAPEGFGSDVFTLRPGRAVQAPGTTQAIVRARQVDVAWDGDHVVIRCPSLLGAMIAKAAGCSEIPSLTAGERLVHQRDLVFLLSIASGLSGGELERMTSLMDRKDRKRLAVAAGPIEADRAHRARSHSVVPFEDVVDAVHALLA